LNEFDYIDTEELLKKKEEELEQLKELHVQKLVDIYNRFSCLRERRLQLEKTSNTHNPDCTCMKCEDK